VADAEHRIELSGLPYTGYTEEEAEEVCKVLNLWAAIEVEEANAPGV